MNRLTCSIAAALVFAASVPAVAQYTGPGSAPSNYRDVADVLKNGADDAQVQLDGYIVRQVGKEKYMFSDGKGEIRVEIDDRHFPNVKIDDKIKVRIRGEVEKDFLESPEIDVEQLTVLN